MQLFPHAWPVVQMRQHDVAWRGVAVTTTGVGVGTKAVRTTVGIGVAGLTVSRCVGTAAGATVAAAVAGAFVGAAEGAAHAVVPSAAAMNSSE